MNNNSKEKEDKKYIYRPWITKNGQRKYAKAYGLKAFKILIKYSKDVRASRPFIIYRRSENIHEKNQYVTLNGKGNWQIKGAGNSRENTKRGY